MIEVNDNEKLWVEKYRPQTIDQCILPTNIANTLQQFINHNDFPNLIFAGGPGCGKAQPLDSDVLTATGYIKMRDVTVGTRVINGNGQLTAVTAVYKQPTDRKIYTITLDDNSTFKVADNHLNSVFYRDNEQCVDCVLDTLTLIDDYRNKQYYIDSVYVTDFQRTPIDDDPYLVGCAIAQFNNSRNVDNDVYQSIISKICNGDCTIENLTIDLSYIFNTVDNRTKLLAGLVGQFIDKRTVTFATSSRALTERFAMLVRSLACKDVITIAHDQLENCDRFVHNVYINENINSANRRIDSARAIVRIEHTSTEPCQCIVVASDDHTYVTDNFTKTHNTTVAKALVNQLGLDYLMINTSLENGIDILRTKITNYVSSVSLNGKTKVVLFDEADYASQAFQPALRALIEKFSTNTRFIFTCNYSNRIIDPIKSRCTVIDFEIPHDQYNELVKRTIKRSFEILTNENVQYDKKTIAKIVTNYFPDIRRLINHLQTISTGKVITDDVINNSEIDDYDKLIDALKRKDFKTMRQWVASNKQVASDKIFTYMYSNANNILQPSSIPQMVITTADYQYKSAFVADQEINTAAYLTEIMANCQFL